MMKCENKLKTRLKYPVEFINNPSFKFHLKKIFIKTYNFIKEKKKKKKLKIQQF